MKLSGKKPAGFTCRHQMVRARLDQYHNWLAGFSETGFPGSPITTAARCGNKMKDGCSGRCSSMEWVILLSYICCRSLWAFSAIWKGSFFLTAPDYPVLHFYSLPSFWIGTMLLVFSYPEYGMDVPSIGLGNLPAGPFWSRFRRMASHLGLPVFCLAYGAGISFPADAGRHAECHPAGLYPTKQYR